MCVVRMRSTLVFTGPPFRRDPCLRAGAAGVDLAALAQPASRSAQDWLGATLEVAPRELESLEPDLDKSLVPVHTDPNVRVGRAVGSGDRARGHVHTMTPSQVHDRAAVVDGKLHPENRAALRVVDSP